VSRGPFLPSLVFVGLFVFPLGGGTGQTDGQTDRQTDGQHRYMMGHPSRKDGPIKSAITGSVSLPFTFLRQSSIPPVGYRTLDVSTTAPAPTTLLLIIPGNQGWLW